MIFSRITFLEMNYFAKISSTFTRYTYLYLFHMTPTYCPEFDICSNHDQAWKEEGDTGRRDGEYRTKVQPT